MILNPYVHYLVSPWALLAEMSCVACLLFYATRLEQIRAADEAPRIIRPYTIPEKPKKHIFWIKTALCSAGTATILAVVVVAVVHHNSKVQLSKVEPGDNSKKRDINPEPAKNNPQKSLPRKRPSSPPVNTAPTKGGGAKASGQPITSALSANPVGTSHITSPTPTVSAPPSITLPAPDAPISCPGNLAANWGLSVQPMFDSHYPPLIQFHASVVGTIELKPILQQMMGPQGQNISLTSDQSKDVSRLIAEIQSRLSSPKTIKTVNDAGAAVVVPVTQTIMGIAPNFQHDSLTVSYASKTPSGVEVDDNGIMGSTMTIPIGRLPESIQHIVTDLDALAKARVNTSCGEALRRIK